VVIDDLSRRAYSAMGFFTEDVIQDQETTGGFFGLTTYLPISIIKYSDSFTWHKYSFRVLPPEMPCQRKIGQEKKTYQNALLEFLQTDVEGITHFQPFQVIEREITRYIVNLIPSDMSSPARKIFFDELVASTEEESYPPSYEKLQLPSQEETYAPSKPESMPHHDEESKSPSQKASKSHNPFPFLEEKAREASIVPFSIFAELFSMRFSIHRMLESTMEIHNFT
jgi:hypothetical protein